MSARTEHGFSIITAIFLIVVIALVAAFMVSIGNVQRTTSPFSMIATRAHFAALSGVEWSVHRVLENPAAPACFATPVTFALAGPGSGNFSVTCTCVETEVTEGADDYSVFDLEVTAEFGSSGQEDYFRRVVAASVSTAL